MGHVYALELALRAGDPFRQYRRPDRRVGDEKDEMASVNVHGKEAINFQLSMLLYAFISGLLMFVVIGILLLPLVALFGFVMPIVAGVKAREGTMFNYPLTIRFIK